MLDIYGRLQWGLSIDTIREFANKINESDESGTLHPQAPISAVPRRFFREQLTSVDSHVVNEFRGHIHEFLEANRKSIRASRIVVDFHVSPGPVPLRYVEAVEGEFRAYEHDGLIDEVVVFT